MTRALGARMARCRALLWGGLALLLGCSASDIKIAAPSNGGGGKTAVLVTIVDKNTGTAIGVKATVIVGGERVTLAAGDETIQVTGVPIGDGEPPSQPLTVTARGFVTFFTLLQLSGSGNTQARVELEEADLTITGTVSGQVTNADSNNPIANVTVEFTPDIPGSPVGVKGATDKRGEYIIGGIPTGKTVGIATAQGFVPTEKSALVIQDSGGGGNTTVDFSLASSSSKLIVRGRVIDLITRDPIKGASVTIGGRGPIVTGSDGLFEVTQVPVGDQVVKVTATGYDAFGETITVLPGMPDLQIELAPKQARPPPAPATILGTVTIRNNPNNAGATVKAIDVRSGKTIATTITEADGTYGLFVPPGRYRIEVTFKTASISKTVTLGGAGRTLTGVDFQITAP